MLSQEEELKWPSRELYIMGTMRRHEMIYVGKAVSLKTESAEISRAAEPSVKDGFPYCQI